MNYVLKYRILTTEELKELENEFIQFLVVHGLLGDEWEKLNKENPNEAIELVEIFSDTVLEKVYDSISYLEFRDTNVIVLLAFSAEGIEQIRIQQKNPFELDLSNWQGLTAAFNSPEKLDAFHGKKHYTINKNNEVHSFVSQGFVPSTSDFWKQIKEYIVPN